MDWLSQLPFYGAVHSAVARLTSRERLMALGLGAVALVLAPLQTYAWSQDAFTDYVAAHGELEAAQQAQFRSRTGSAISRVNTQIERIRAWSWRAPSAEIGRVMLEDQILTLATKAGLSGVSVKSSTDLIRIGDLNLTRVEMDAKLDWPRLNAFLAALHDTGKGVVVDTFQTTEDNPPQVQLVMALPLNLAKENGV